MENNWHILIVDDDRSIHQQLNDELRTAGFEVTNVYDGQSALDFIEREGLPHLAVIDYRLPERDLADFCWTKKTSNGRELDQGRVMFGFKRKGFGSFAQEKLFKKIKN